MNPKVMFVYSLLLMPASALAQESTQVQEADLQRQLAVAQQKLEEAAHQVADLSTQLDGTLLQGFPALDGAFGRGLIGVQLDPSSGKDGARVLEVSPGGPAAEAGIRPGDVIVAVNGTEVTGDDTSRQVVKIIRQIKPDSKVSVRVLRDGKTQNFTVIARPGPDIMMFGDSLRDLAPLPPMRQFMVHGPLSNMELATLTPQLGKYFGTDKGVLVVRAPAEGAMKLEDGDVILAIDGRVPTSGSHATRILGSYQPGEKVMLRIVRQRKTLDLETTVPERPADPRKVNIIHGREHAPGGGGTLIMRRFGDEMI